MFSAWSAYNKEAVHLDILDSARIFDDETESGAGHAAQAVEQTNGVPAPAPANPIPRDGRGESVALGCGDGSKVSPKLGAGPSLGWPHLSVRSE